MERLTEAERVILENLPKEWKWIVREKNYDIYVYEDKPLKSGDYWHFKSGDYWHSAFSEMPFKHLFQFIKWSDEEPYEIEKLLEKGGEK